MEVNETNFRDEVLNSPIPVLVDFWAEWCVPCKMIEPIVLELEKEYAGKLKVVRVNVDENQNLAIEYGIMSIPTLGIFVNGLMVDQIVGAVPKRVIVDKLKKYLLPN
ncbi:thioredoxin [Caldisericum exile]|uniref:Thioredoxin n=1 Tax=Caldisericum exile (strain DSM 21853 / NBRC 104410 / AZM16c01) TaxID=511051 RepID=A0A7U6GEX0_CALEA|nr:thioredoxin [Caldisericum exile]BAL81121.1 thioredoxin [Caldisericum exile AZM16c01]